MNFIVMLTLRYAVETRHRPAFTASRRVASIEAAQAKVARLCRENKNEGYIKNSGFSLYDSSNNVIKTFETSPVS